MESYTAYVAIQDAINHKNIDDLRTATAEFEAANSELSDEQMDTLELLIGGEIYDVVFTAAIILGTADTYEAYLNDNTIENAVALVEAYELAVIDCDIPMEAFVTGITDMTYTGKAITQDQMKITVNGEDVVIGEDVTVTYKDNVEVGTATIEIGATQNSNYTEKHTVTFTIKEAVTSPKTGDSSMMPIVASVSVLAFIGAVIFRKRLIA